MKVLVMDYGGSAIKYSVMDENGAQEGRSEVPAPRTIGDFKNVSGSLIREFEGKVEGIAVSFPGFIQLNGDLTGGGAYPYLHGHNLIEEFSALTSIKNIAIENDGKAGALAECWDGPLADGSSGVVIIIGTGIAGGLVLDRKVIKNKHCTAGELSAFSFDPQGVSMNSFAMNYCAASSLCSAVAKAKGQISEQDKLMAKLYGYEIDLDSIPVDHKYDGVTFDGIQVFKMIDEGDPDALAAYDRMVKGMAALCANMQIVFAPDRICIGGGVTKQERVVPDIIKAYREMLLPMCMMLNGQTDPATATLSDNYDAEIVRCKHSSDANQYGAMYNYLMKYAPDVL